MGAPEVQFPCGKISRTYRSRMCKLAMRQALRLSKIMCIFVCHVASRPLSKTRRARLDVRGAVGIKTLHIYVASTGVGLGGGDKTLTLLFCRIPRGACLGRSLRGSAWLPRLRPASDACSSSSSTSPHSSEQWVQETLPRTSAAAATFAPQPRSLYFRLRLRLRAARLHSRFTALNVHFAFCIVAPRSPA